MMTLTLTFRDYLFVAGCGLFWIFRESARLVPLSVDHKTLWPLTVNSRVNGMDQQKAAVFFVNGGCTFCGCGEVGEVDFRMEVW